MTDTITIREYRAEDFDAVTILWRIAREKAMPDFQRAKGYFFFQDREYFQNRVLNENSVCVADVSGRAAAFMALRNDFIDHLYVDPDYQRRGIGKMFLDFAKKKSPEHVWLYTLQVNVNARTFYEKNGFVAETLGVSPAPENEPDVEYHWRKSLFL
jgi:ribosomal protein S18 acetylase RimI-like enzyme